LCDFLSSTFPFYFCCPRRAVPNSLASPWVFTDWFPKMCSCIDGSSTLPSNRAASYERLGSDLTIFELNNTMRRNRRSDQDLIDSERQVCIILCLNSLSHLVLDCMYTRKNREDEYRTVNFYIVFNLYK